MTTFYVATDDGFLVVRQNPQGWLTEYTLEGMSVQCVAVDPVRPERAWCGTYGHGAWYSEDACTTWQTVGQGITYPDVTAIAASGHNNHDGAGVVYAGTEPAALFRSDTGQALWEELPGLRSLPSAPTWSFPPRPQTSHVRVIALDPHRPGTLYVAIEAGALVRSPDGGRTWLDRVPGGPHDSHTLAVHLLAPGRIYAAAGDGYAESADWGETWQWLEEGLQHGYIWGLAVDPGDPDTIVISAARSAGQAHSRERASSAVYRKTRGEVWQRATDGLPGPDGLQAPVLASRQSEPGVFYLACTRGIYRSSDAGLIWQRLPIDAPKGRQVARPQALAVVE